jgi:flagellar biosynthesis component FlhA
MSSESKNLKIALLITGVLLCLAVIPVMPHGYYTLLRLAVCCTAGYVIYKLKNHEQLSRHLIPLAVVAVLFNPLIPVHIDRFFWLPIDLGVAVYFLTLSKKL